MSNIPNESEQSSVKPSSNREKMLLLADKDARALEIGRVMSHSR